MRVLVTGGAGFLGSHLSERLAARGDLVVALDDLSTGRRENLGAIPGALALGSVLDAELVERLVAECDLVVHLAAVVGVRRVVARPGETLEVNVRGTELVLSAAARRGTPVVLASSSEVYGDRARVPFREDDDVVLGPPDSPRWSYACSKAVGEWRALAWHREAGLPVVVVRFFNVVGPRQVGDHGMVLPRLAAQAARGEPLTVHGDGLQTRCFCHVEDAVEAVVRLADAARAPHVRGRVFNVGAEREVTIRALAARVRALSGADVPIEHVPHEAVFGPRFTDPRRRVPDLARLERAIGFRPGDGLDRAAQEALTEARARGEKRRVTG
jgi:UDP-glucose 4-epimerase